MRWREILLRIALALGLRMSTRTPTVDTVIRPVWDIMFLIGETDSVIVDVAVAGAGEQPSVVVPDGEMWIVNFIHSQVLSGTFTWNQVVVSHPRGPGGGGFIAGAKYGTNQTDEIWPEDRQGGLLDLKLQAGDTIGVSINSFSAGGDVRHSLSVLRIPLQGGEMQQVT